MNIITITTTANPELLRQALELVLVLFSAGNPWDLSVIDDQATITSNLEVEALQAIATFVESTPDFSSATYIYTQAEGFSLKPVEPPVEPEPEIPPVIVPPVLTSVLTTLVNPELFRQALELVLGSVSESNSWNISTAGSQATINSILTQEAVQAIATFLESTPDFSAQFYTWNGTAFKENLPALRADALLKIDVAAGQTRLKYLTSIPGQDATYLAKEADCRAYKAAAYPEDTTGYQWVVAEAEATGLTPTEATDAIILQANQWRVVGSMIEKVRRGGKIEVSKKIKKSTIEASLSATLAALQGL